MAEVRRQSPASYGRIRGEGVRGTLPERQGDGLGILDHSRRFVPGDGLVRKVGPPQRAGVSEHGQEGHSRPSDRESGSKRTARERSRLQGQGADAEGPRNHHGGYERRAPAQERIQTEDCPGSDEGDDGCGSREPVLLES